MLIKFFPNGKGAGAGPVGYLVAQEVLAYDADRDLIRDADGQPLVVTREPLPEVLRGDPTRTEALIDASTHQWTYRAGVISFAHEDAPNEAQQAEVMDAFEQLAFAGLDGEQYEMLWVRHSHEDRVELHFCTPRLELTSDRSLNIAPPGYQNAFDSLRDVMNKTHGWADPMELERAQEVRETIEAPNRAQGRDELHAWILDQVSLGLITDRASMIGALTDAGFDLPRAGKAYLTAQDPDTSERWRLKGEIFHEDWQADSAEREIERGAGLDSAGARRLNDGRELVLDRDTDGLGDGAAGAGTDRSGGADLAGDGSRPDNAKELHAGGHACAVYQDQGEMNDDAPDSLGTRLARLRRAVGDGLRNLSNGIERLGGTIDEDDARRTRWFDRLRDVAHTFASGFNGSVAWLVERRSELQHAGRSTADELELSEGRRREAETELKERDHGLGHGL